MRQVKRILFIIIVSISLTISALMIFSKSPVISDVVNKTSVAPSKSSLSSNRYTQLETEVTGTINPLADIDGYTLIGSNLVSNLALYVNEADLSIRVVDLETNFVFGSSVNVSEDDDELNQTWQKRVISPVFVQYYTSSNLQEEYLFQNPGSKFTYSEYNELGRTGFEARLSFALSKVKLTLLVYLDDQGLNVEIPNEFIEEDDSTADTSKMLSSITPYPFFGVTKGDLTSGYVFIPDGVGALMRFNDKNISSTYTKKFFGNESATSLSEKSLFANVYGMVHGANQNGFLAIIEDGSAQASFVYTPTGNPINYNYANVGFEYRVSYTQFLNQSQTSSVRLVQGKRNQFDIKMLYLFLNNEKANYVGMANAYQAYLVNQGDLVKTTYTDIPLHLDVLMAENKKSLFGRKTFRMTAFSDVNLMINTLKLSGIENLDINLFGFEKGGLSYQGPSYTKIESVVGSKSSLSKLLKQDVNIYFVADYVTAYKNAKGYNMNDVSQTIGQQLMTEDNNYLLSHTDGLKKYQSNYKTLNKTYKIDQMALSSIGNHLYRDYSTDQYREDMIDVARAYLNVSEKTSVINAFSYLFGASAITDAPMYSSQQTKFTDTVPFYSYVLSGHKATFARNANFFSNTSNELLRMIDYHLYPSFYVTKASSYLLLDTGSEHIFTSRFKDWESEITRQYNYVNEALKHVSNNQVTSRVIVETGVVYVSYDNGVSILINYTGELKTYLGTQVLPQDYEVIL